MAKAIAKKGKTALREDNLLAEVREMILSARVQVARAVDAGLVTLYWNVGRRIRQDILKEKRADYGESIVSAVGRELGIEFGRGFSEKSIRPTKSSEICPFSADLTSPQASKQLGGTS